MRPCFYEYDTSGTLQHVTYVNLNVKASSQAAKRPDDRSSPEQSNLCGGRPKQSVKYARGRLCDSVAVYIEKVRKSNAGLEETAARSWQLVVHWQMVRHSWQTVWQLKTVVRVLLEWTCGWWVRMQGGSVCVYAKYFLIKMRLEERMLGINCVWLLFKKFAKKKMLKCWMPFQRYEPIKELRMCKN